MSSIAADQSVRVHPVPEEMPQERLSRLYSLYPAEGPTPMSAEGAERVGARP